MQSSSQQTLVDTFFTNLYASSGERGVEMARGISDRGFAKARSYLHMPALRWLNNWVLERANNAGLMNHWRGLRLVAADASVFMPAVKAFHRTRFAASATQRLFALYLPDSELTLHASVHSDKTSERSMLMDALDSLQADDVLLLDRGYPASWLVSVLGQRGVKFCMRCDKQTTGWSAVKQFLRSGANEAQVCLSAPSADDVQDWGCSSDAPQVRLVRHVSSNGTVRVLATNLDSHDVPCVCFGELYHKRWRIEEGFKRLKHRLHLESVSGLSQHSVIIDVAAKVLADNLASLLCKCAMLDAPLTSSKSPSKETITTRQCNRSYAATVMQRILPSVLLWLGDVVSTLQKTLHILQKTYCRIIPGRSSPRPKQHLKPHKRFAYK